MFKCKVLVQRHSSKKNEKEPRRRGNKTFIGKSDRAKQAEDWLILKLRSEKLKQRIDTITDDLNAKFTFYFPYGTKDNKLEYSIDSDTWESAYKRASSYCFDFYVKQMSNFNEEKGLDVIDSCVNPR
jgi:hypothetical protein